MVCVSREIQRRSKDSAPRCHPTFRLISFSRMRREPSATSWDVRPEPLDPGPGPVGFGVLPGAGASRAVGRPRPIDRKADEALREEVEQARGAPVLDRGEPPGRVEVVVERVRKALPCEVAGPHRDIFRFNR